MFVSVSIYILVNSAAYMTSKDNATVNGDLEVFLGCFNKLVLHAPELSNEL
jgi:hypothetical protein